MKIKLAFLLIAATALTALVASGQDTTYTITSGKTAETQQEAKTKNFFYARPPYVTAPYVTAPAVALPKGGNYATAYSNGGSTVYAITNEEAGLSHQAEMLAQQLGTARSDSDRDKIKGQLSELLEKQFNERQKRHEAEIKQLEEQIKKLKDLVDKRQENRHQIITDRLNQIVRESQGLGW